jgi:hypothetical protein
MNDNSMGLEQSLFLLPDLLGDLQTFCLIRKLGGKFRRAEQTAILDRIE